MIVIRGKTKPRPLSEKDIRNVASLLLKQRGSIHARTAIADMRDALINIIDERRVVAQELNSVKAVNIGR